MAFALSKSVLPRLLPAYKCARSIPTRPCTRPLHRSLLSRSESAPYFSRTLASLARGRTETFQIRPSGPQAEQEEAFRLSPLDLIVTQNYSTWALIFKLESADTAAIAETFKRALAATLGQCRHFVGTVEKGEGGSFSIVKKPDSTARFDVKWLDGPGDDFPSFAELERAKFSSQSLGDPGLLTIEGMSMASKRPPGTSPEVSGFQLTFIPGGMIFNVHKHHAVCDVTGTTSLVHQIADHCYSIRHGTPPPAWDEAFMDRSRFIPPPVDPKDQVQPPPPPPRHPDWLPCSWLLFHLPQSRVAELKQLAAPGDGTQISTYDALTAFLWRVMMRNRAQIYLPDLSLPAVFLESVNMRGRLTPKVSERYQGNLLCGGLSQLQEKQLTLGEVISEVPLPRLAAYIRQITAGVDARTLEGFLAAMTPVADVSAMHSRLDIFPPMSLAVTDWRRATMCARDFGFGRPAAAKQIADVVYENMMMIYPQRPAPEDSAAAADQGLEVVIPFETHAVDLLIQDPDMQKYFEFVGYEAGAP
ncbi:transferase family-domain-containing protein [Durotheca rogersii]|uniref:transferase family-domain-containing protein n=1 Tax=Durotheca rogersii TaxID=419775 RepID=UPI00221F8F73|nr:transferase family-domain-containing protein [Durotheca rogersii]KAI5862016.1 transferase family-domain-containing protein [Durotheca rogersii]